MMPLAPILCYVGCLNDFTPAPGHQADGIQMLEVFPKEAETPNPSSQPARGLIAYIYEEAGNANDNAAGPKADKATEGVT